MTPNHANATVILAITIPTQKPIGLIKPVKIFNANHINMAVIMPKGKNILEFKFYPNSYYNYRILEMLTAIFLYGVLIYILYFKINNNRKLVIGE